MPAVSLPFLKIHFFVCFRYISVFLILTVISRETSDSYNLIDTYKIEGSLIFDDPLKFDKNPSEPIILPDEFFKNNLLTVPFIIYTSFKLDDIVYPCVFSIEDDDGNVKLRLCLSLATAEDMRLTLTTGAEHLTEHSLTFHIDSVTDSMSLLLNVNKKSMGIKVNCYDAGYVDLIERIGDVEFVNAEKLFMGRTGKEEHKANFLEGEIFELQIHSGPELDKTIHTLCPPEGVITERGEKGQKGEPGESLAGPRGPIGPPGRKGEKGVCQCSESVISSLIRSMPETRGSPGDPGPRGDTGDIGPTGMTGKPGEQGERGPQGLKGETGERGDDGEPGKDGNPGRDGRPGKDGDPGPPGPRGLTGPPGPPGSGYKETEDTKEVAVPGEKGEQGPIGPPGPTGQRGEPGDRGEKGDRGLRGEKGDRGHTGPEGPRGEKGEQGKSGLDGIPGVPGSHGRAGAEGKKGDKGDSGLPGMPASLSSILDSDINPIERDEIIEKIRGQKGEMGASGIKGEKGDQGQVGPQGPSGEHGKHGHPGAKGEPGPVGPKGSFGDRGEKGDTGSPGPIGPPGNVPMSEIALLKGSKGDRGLPGNLGPQGHKGQTGPRGPTGPRGHRGYSGKVGPKGQKGDSTSSVNLNKLKGDKGDRGDTGLPGETGKEGPPGASCTCSNTSAIPLLGPAGPPGPPGVPGLSIKGSKGEPGEIISDANFYTISDITLNDESDNEDFFYTTTTVVYKTITALVKRTSSTPLGTLAYVLQKKILLLRVESGWQHVMMGSAFDTRDMHTAAPRHVPETFNRQESTETPFTASGGEIRLIALNTPQSGKIFTRNAVGWAAAEGECHKQAKKYLVNSGSFTAFMANSIRNLRHLVASYAENFPVTNFRGEILFDSWSRMFNGSGAIFKTWNTDIYSFDGKNVMIDPTWPKKMIWHGSDVYGNCTKNASCADWRSDNAKHFGTASSLFNKQLLREEKHTCDNRFVVLCVEATPKIRSSSNQQRHYISRRQKQRYLRGAHTRIPSY